MIRVNNIHLSLDYDDKSVRKAVAKQLRIEEKSIKSCKIFMDFSSILKIGRAHV